MNSVQGKIDTAEIDTVVFDIGRVLVSFSFEPFQNFLHSHGLEPASTEEFIEQARVLDFEHGRIDSATFLTHVQSLLPQASHPEALAQAWVNIFNEIPEMLELLDRLKQRYRVLLLSNTNELHWEHLDSAYALSSRTDGVITSFAAKAMKPDPAIYAFAEEHFAIAPHRTLFIDDLAQNIATAQSRGWNGIVHQTLPKTISEIEQLLNHSVA